MPGAVSLTQDVQRRIEAGRGDLPGALARIADFILKEPEVAVRASMADLADLTTKGPALLDSSDGSDFGWAACGIGSAGGDAISSRDSGRAPWLMSQGLPTATRRRLRMGRVDPASSTRPPHRGASATTERRPRRVERRAASAPIRRTQPEPS